MLILIFSFCSKAGPVPDLPIWNYLNVGDILKPKILVCKAGRFLDKFDHMIKTWGDTTEGEPPFPHGDAYFENPDFEENCDPSYLKVKKKTKTTANKIFFSALGISSPQTVS